MNPMVRVFNRQCLLILRMEYRFHDALSTQKHSLQVLHLNDRGQQQLYEHSPYDEFQPEPLWFGSMAEFTKIRELRMPCGNLFNMPRNPMDVAAYLKDNIPTSLEYLYIGSVLSRSLGFLTVNLTGVLAWRSRFQALKKVGFELDMELLSPEEMEFSYASHDALSSMNMKGLLMSQFDVLQKEGIEAEFRWI